MRILNWNQIFISRHKFCTLKLSLSDDDETASSFLLTKYYFLDLAENSEMYFEKVRWKFWIRESLTEMIQGSKISSARLKEPIESLADSFINSR